MSDKAKLYQEPTRNLPTDERGSKYYSDGAAYHIFLLVPWAIVFTIGTILMLIAIVSGFSYDLNSAIIFGIGAFIVYFVFLVIFFFWFINYTKRKITFNGKEVLMATQYGLFPCYQNEVEVEAEQINAFFIKPTLITNFLPGQYKRFRVYLQTLGQQEFLVASENVLNHQKKLVKLFMKQPGLTNLGEVERIIEKQAELNVEREKREKEREKILKERQVAREKRLKELEKRKKEGLDDMDEDDRDNAKSHWRRVKDHKRLREKYGGIF